MVKVKNNLPNILTGIRVALTLPAAMFLKWGYFYVPLLIFFIAAITDFMDGYFARKYNVESAFGKLLDPLADKILYLSILLMFIDVKYIAICPVILIFMREFIALSFGSLLLVDIDDSVDILAGKIKNFLQSLSILIIFLTKGQFYSNEIMWFVSLFTVCSAFIIYYKNKNKFDNSIFKGSFDIPNMLTMIRIIFVFPIISAIIYNQKIVASSFLIITLITDFLDGYIARKLNKTTPLGAILDPLADKILYLSSLSTCVYMGYVGSIPIIIILIRELIITGTRSSCLSLGKCFPASKHGKYKMILQSITIFSLIILNKSYISTTLVYLTVLATSISGIVYMINMFKFIKNNFDKKKAI